VARREPKQPKPLEVSVMFEPSRLTPAHIAQAYEQVVPITRCTVSRTFSTRQAEREKTMPHVARRMTSWFQSRPLCTHGSRRPSKLRAIRR
jgi:hypothetical protein